MAAHIIFINIHSNIYLELIVIWKVNTGTKLVKLIWMRGEEYLTMFICVNARSLYKNMAGHIIGNSVTTFDTLRVWSEK